MWPLQGKHYADCCVRECSSWGGGSVMVWGGILWRYRTPLVIIKGNLTSRLYIDEVLEPVVEPFLQNHADVKLHINKTTPELIQQGLQQTFLDKTMCMCYIGQHSLLIWLSPMGGYPQYKIQHLIQSMRCRCQTTIIDVNGG